jgi:hypothetical protein
MVFAECSLHHIRQVMKVLAFGEGGVDEVMGADNACAGKAFDRQSLKIDQGGLGGSMSDRRMLDASGGQQHEESEQ